MASDNTLIFGGTRWQTARAVRAGSTLFEIKATGSGRSWSTDTTLGFWRTFSELPLNDGKAIAGFVKRYGDPWNQLEPGKPIHTAYWGELQGALHSARRAWKIEEDEHGVSHFGTDFAWLGFLKTSLLVRDPKLLSDLDPMFEPANGLRVVLRVRTLASFMKLSAASAIERRVPMRRCAHCGHWLEVDRSDRRFCSSSCRSLHSQQRKDE